MRSNPTFKSGFLLAMSDADSTEIAVGERQVPPLRKRFLDCEFNLPLLQFRFNPGISATIYRAFTISDAEVVFKVRMSELCNT